MWGSGGRKGVVDCWVRPLMDEELGWEDNCGLGSSEESLIDLDMSCFVYVNISELVRCSAVFCAEASG